MEAILNVLLALGILILVWFVWGFLQQLFPDTRTVKLTNSRKGIDNIGVAVTFACHDGEGNYIVSKRSQNTRDEQGRWDKGGGSIEYGEDIEKALVREIKEEYLCDVISHEFLGYRDVHRRLQDGTPTHWVVLDYKVHVHRSQAGIGEPESIDELRWVTLDAIPQPQHSQLQNFIDKYRDKL